MFEFEFEFLEILCFLQDAILVNVSTTSLHLSFL